MPFFKEIQLLLKLEIMLVEVSNDLLLMVGKLSQNIGKKIIILYSFPICISLADPD